jgi:vitamin B12 transporter
MWAALGVRGTEAQGFWGDSGVDITGQGAVNRVYVQAPAEDYTGGDGGGTGGGSNSGGGGSGDSGGSGSGGGSNTGGGGSSVEAPPPGRNCGGGDGSGGGTGTGNGAGAVGYFPGIPFGLRQLDRQQHLGVINGAAELSFSPFANAEVLLGYGYHWLVREDSAQIPGDYSFNAGLAYRFTPELRLRGGASRKIRTPSIRQLYDVAGGNPNLGFETAYIYETGLTYEFSRTTSLGITGFLNDVYDFIERDPVTGLYRNYQHYRFEGLEFTGETRWFSSLRLRAGYTLMDSKDLSSGTSKDQIQYVPTHKLALDAHYDIGAGFSADVFYWYFSDQYYYTRRAPFEKAELAPYGLLNAKLGFTLPAARQDFILYIGVDNLLDTKYQQSYGLPQPGRFIYGGIQAAFF